MIELEGYTINEEIYSDSKSYIFRGVRLADNLSVIIKTLRTDYPTPKELAQLRHEYELTKELNLKGSVRALALVNHQNSLALILEDMGGESLKRIVNEKRLTIPQVLKIAIQLATSLSELHRHHIIHKDLKLANIIANLATEQVRITDFSISTRLSVENQHLSTLDKLEGTVAYMSPEQTGRMNRVLDYRTDFYSLGVSLYELLVGWLPFQSNDPMELIHCHVAKIPIAPHVINPEIPKPISDIVMKLLAKNAEERYQSADGLKFDLQVCLRALSKHGIIEDFRLGRQDVVDKFQLPQKLYGRTAELTALLDSFEYIAQGNKSALLVFGESGMGKTVLVQQLQKPVMQKRGFFCKGRFEGKEQNQPYSALIYALREIIQYLLTEPVSQIAQWRRRFISALGNDLAILIQAIPELETIVGKPAENTHPSFRDEAENLFKIAFEKITQVLARTEHPVVMFIDDVQWADFASMKLMQSIITDTEVQALLLVVGYRDSGEMGERHSLLPMIETLNHYLIPVEQIHLKALRLEHVNHLIADTLHCSLNYVRPLAEMVMTKTEGHPFFVNAFLNTVYQEKALSFNYSHKRWEWDVNAIAQLDMTDNVVAVISDRLQKLSDNAQEVLKLAACIGLEFNIQHLAALYEQSETITTTALWEAVEQNLVAPLNSYQLLYGAIENHPHESELHDISYRFVHERIQRAAYSLLSDEERQVIHYQLGTLLRNNTALGQLEENLFNIVKHLNLGIEQINSDPEKYELARLNLAVAKKARNTGAYDSALGYLQIGLSLLPEDCWEKQYNLSMALHIQAMEIEYANHHVEKADRLFSIVLTHAQSLLDQAKVYEIRILFFVAQNQLQKAIDMGLQVLDMLNYPLPNNAPPLTELVAQLQPLVNDKTIEQLIDLPVMKDQHKLAALRILISISLPAYFIAPALYPIIGMQQIRLCLQAGNSAMAASSYASYGLILCGMNQLEAGYRYGQLALKILERYPNKEYQARTLTLVNAFTRHWHESAHLTVKELVKTSQHALEQSNIEYACHAGMYSSIYAALVSESLTRAHEICQMALDIMIRFKPTDQIYYTQITQIWAQYILNLQGDGRHPSVLKGVRCDEELLLPQLHAQKNQHALFCFYLVKTLLSYSLDTPENALIQIQKAEFYANSATASLHYGIYVFYYALILIAIYPSRSEEKQSQLLKQILGFHEQLQRWSRHSPINFLHKYELVNAELARLNKKVAEALTHYEQAIQHAHANAYILEEAIINELAANFYEQLGIQKAAKLYRADAHYGYLNWGASAKVKQLEAQFSYLTYRHRRDVSEQAIEQKGIHEEQILSTHTVIQSNSNFDLLTVLKLSQAISGEISLAQLIRKLLHAVMENLGAQQGLLILNHGNQLYLEAEVKADKTNDVVFQSLPLDSLTVEQQKHYPVSLVHYVVRTRTSLMLHDASREGLFINDAYVLSCQPRSILCHPLFHKDELIGVLYLENSLIANAFTSSRSHVLQLLSAQIATAIENALFYERLESAKASAESASRAKSAFLMNMSHELRTPMNAILGYADLVREEAAEKGHDDILPDLEKIQTASRQLLDIISNILDISKIEADKMGLNLSLLDVEKIARDVVTLIEPVISDNELQVNCAANVGKIYADAVKIQQILLNLLGNAAKFTHQGRITFTITRHLNDPTLGNSPADWLVFEIADTGIGIASESLQYIFEAFYQLDSSTTRQHGGTGLGLTISERFCRMMGGRITVTSEVGRGSTFIVYLPAQVMENVALAV